VIDTCGTEEGTELVGTKTGDLYVGGTVTVLGGTNGGETTGTTWDDGTVVGKLGDGTTQIPVVIETCGTDDGTDGDGTKTGDEKVGGITTVDGAVQAVGAGGETG
jgi:hypothetical protein